MAQFLMQMHTYCMLQVQLYAILEIVQVSLEATEIGHFQMLATAQ